MVRICIGLILIVVYIWLLLQPDFATWKAVMALFTHVLGGLLLIYFGARALLRGKAGPQAATVSGPAGEDRVLLDLLASDREDKKEKVRLALSSILASEPSLERKEQRVKALLEARNFFDKRNGVRFCSCGFPTTVWYHDGTSGPIFDWVDAQRDPDEEYTVRYRCPQCGSHIQTITQ
jgi:hypothetical protein